VVSLLKSLKSCPTGPQRTGEEKKLKKYFKKSIKKIFCTSHQSIIIIA
jgi:hypothetical protein